MALEKNSQCKNSNITTKISENFPLVMSKNHGDEGNRGKNEGHVLVITQRKVERMKDLTPEELSDMWLLAQQVSVILEQQYNASSATFAIQDDIKMILNRMTKYILRYVFLLFDTVLQNAPLVGNSQLEKDSKHGKKLDLDDKTRKVQSFEEMAKESQTYREALEKYLKD
ncbi:hypothetical protein RFI_31105 [Reticulomyxa filosa]|uniref:HIT domain-containing protein n=1 Tax=Reticulomyxa filosa TaxID=46433 RepID=X6LZX0_RETFI|nr:hypothetical protein RFI_31105 [Reticulomyxa filosa]|eukprot:ETO06290.1 hypothetical protein RFI_31105 [Reticulomyxa filosa]